MNKSSYSPSKFCKFPRRDYNFDFDEKIRKQKKVKVKEELALKKVSNIISDNANNRMKIVEHESRLGVQVRAKYDEMEELRRQEESRQQRISTAKEDLAAAELELANLPVYERPKDEIDRLYNQILEIEYSANQKGSQKSERGNLINQKKRTLWQCTEKLKDLENANNKLLQALQRSGADKIFDAYRWLQEHRNELNKEVYGPVLLEVNVPNREHAGYLENHVPYYVWKSFITQDAADRDFLFRSLKSFDVPVLNFTGDKGDTKLPFEVSEEMHRLGIYSRLDQVFDAPNAVKDVLTTQFGLENSVIVLP
ncbi:hypothetical protein GIB67_040055 [Kingdonia uniflora]|uniref:Structural maintenance of chromosomes protein 5 n=1 Tax=Kingdonia uniflora TaxID=39325 RepID=A0A7J7MUC9_9MAGN|nr:hypothetical protein GIB67_040055 [Kingdonia uniflora]